MIAHATHHRISLCQRLAVFFYEATLRCCVACRDPFGISRLLVPPPCLHGFCEVLASTDHSIRFSPVVDARCRPPMSKITLPHPFMGKTVRIIRNPTAHCKQCGNKNEIAIMVRTKSCAYPVIRESHPHPFARIWCGRILARANSAPDFRHG